MTRHLVDGYHLDQAQKYRFEQPAGLRVETMLLPSNWVSLLQHSLLYGAMLSAGVSVLFLVGAYLNPEIMLRGYPPDIKARYGEGSPATKRQRSWLALAVGLVLFGTLALAIMRLPQAIGGELTFVATILCVFIMLFIFNLVDLVVLDWLIFNTLQPKFIVLPGTAGMAGYRDYGFHFKAFLRGTLILLVASPIIAAIAMLVSRVIS
jgi:hypothetical protein